MISRISSGVNFSSKILLNNVLLYKGFENAKKDVRDGNPELGDRFVNSINALKNDNLNDTYSVMSGNKVYGSPTKSYLIKNGETIKVCDDNETLGMNVTDMITDYVEYD